MKKANSACLAAFFLVIALALHSNVARAGNWSSAALGCNVDPGETSIYYPYKYDVPSGTGGFVSFDPAKTGQIDLYCAVQYPNGLSGPTALSLTYGDSTASSTNHIVARYFKMDKSTAALTTIATVDTASTSGCGITMGIHQCSATFADTMNLGSYIYLVKITLYRTATSVSENAYSVQLSP